jgi:hypothetical protein
MAYCKKCGEPYLSERPKMHRCKPAKPDWATAEEWAEIQATLEWRTATENQDAWDQEPDEVSPPEPSAQ